MARITSALAFTLQGTLSKFSILGLGINIHYLATPRRALVHYVTEPNLLFH